MLPKNKISCNKQLPNNCFTLYKYVHFPVYIVETYKSNISLSD